MQKLILFCSTFVVAAGLASAAAAQDCRYGQGDYVLVPWLQGPVVGMVIEPYNECYSYTVRMLEDGDPETPLLISANIFQDKEMTPFAGEPPHRNPFGCPYAPGDSVDVLVNWSDWMAGTVAATDKECETGVSYLNGDAEAVASVAGYSLADKLRPHQDMPQPEPGPVAETCDLGETLETVAANDPYRDMKVAVITGITKESKSIRVAIDFRSIRVGDTFTVADGGTFLADHKKAKIGSTVTPYRIEAAICGEHAGQPTARNEGEYDIFCYSDVFGDLLCQ